MAKEVTLKAEPEVSDSEVFGVVAKAVISNCSEVTIISVAFSPNGSIGVFYGEIYEILGIRLKIPVRNGELSAFLPELP